MAKTVIITGSTRGIGFHTAKEFLINGDNVVIFCRHASHGKQALKELHKLTGSDHIRQMVGDVSNPKDVKRIIAETIQWTGSIDVLINNAGICRYKSLADTPDSEIESIIDINLKGTLYGIKSVLPIMKQQKKGLIITISSGLGVMGKTNYSVYCGSKFGLVGVTKSMAEELAGTGITVYAALPGGVDTKLYRDMHPTRSYAGLMSPEYMGKKIFDVAKSSRPNGTLFKIYN